MADPIDPRNVILAVAASASGPFAVINDIEDFDHGRSSGTKSRRYVFARATPYVRTGEKTDTFEHTGLYNPADTGGQNVLRNSYENDTSIFLAFITNGEDGELPTGNEEGWYQEVQVTEYSESAAADDEFVEVSFSSENVGERVALTAGLPGGVS